MMEPHISFPYYAMLYSTQILFRGSFADQSRNPRVYEYCVFVQAQRWTTGPSVSRFAHFGTLPEQPYSLLRTE